MAQPVTDSDGVKNSIAFRSDMVTASLQTAALAPPTPRDASLPARRCTLADRHFIGINALAADPPPNYTLLHGGFRFETRRCALGGVWTVQMQHPQPLPPGVVLLKYGRPRDSEPEQWYEYPAIISGDTVTYVVAGDSGAHGNDDTYDELALAPVAIAMAVQPTPLSVPGVYGAMLLAALCGVAALFRWNGSRREG